MRHTPPHGTIIVAWDATPERLQFSIADSGPGIAPADLPHVFVPLHRGDSAHSRAAEGAGLGLATAQRIAQLHGGELCAANRPEGGALLAGWLPTQQAAPSPTITS